MLEELVKQVALLQRQVDGLIKPEVPLGLSLISETVLTGSVASVTFSSIPQGFRSLLLLTLARTDVAAESDNVLIQFNADAGANYDYQQVTGSSATAAAAAGRAIATGYTGTSEGANSRANNFAAGFIFIPGYAVSGQERRAMTLTQRTGDLSADADLAVLFRATTWRSTVAVSSIVLVPATGPNFVSGSRFQLYGIM